MVKQRGEDTGLIAPLPFRVWWYGSPYWIVVSFICLIGVHGTEYVTPLGFAHGSVYVLAVVAAGLSGSVLCTGAVTVATITLTAIGFYVSPPWDSSIYILLNRAVSVLILATIGGLAILLIRYVGMLTASLDQAEESAKVLERTRNLLDIGGRIARIGGWRNIIDGADESSWKVLWSPSVLDILNIPVDRFITFQQALDHFSPRHRDRVLALFRNCAKHGTPYDTEAEVFKADGRPVWIRIIGQAVRGPSGQVIEVHGAVQDITEQHEMADRLRAAQRLEAVGQLTGGVAHDFNNLLTVIIGNLQYIRERIALDEKATGLVDMAQTAARRGAELTDRLLTFARRQTLDPRPINVNRQLQDMEPLLRRVLGEDVEIEVVMGGGLWAAMADSSQLENALLNLCLNARDAMPDGGRLTLEARNAFLDDAYASNHEEVEAGEYVMLAVSDSGTGMNSQTLIRAFEPFFTTKEKGRGSGLGLSMVFGFAKQSQGHVKIYSEMGQGTTVKLYLPRTDVTVAAAPVRDARETVLRGDHERILMVEDDSLVRQHVAMLLEDLGYAVTVAVTGAEALRILKENGGAFDLLFTDVVMPGGMNGRQLAEEAGRLYPDLPVLFTSGYTENAIIHHGRLDPGVNLLQKPYRREELSAKIRSVLAEGPDPKDQSG